MRQYIVTAKVHNPDHNPRDKKTGHCIFSEMCTDSTGHHHSTMIWAENIEDLKSILKVEHDNPHITRIEEI